MYIKIKLFIVSIACLLFSAIVFFWYFNNSEIKENQEKIQHSEQLLKNGKKVKVTSNEKYFVATYDNKPFGYSCEFYYDFLGKKYTQNISFDSVSQIAEYKKYDSIIINESNPEIYSFNPKEDIEINTKKLNKNKLENSFPWFYLVLFIGSIVGILFSVKQIKRN